MARSSCFPAPSFRIGRSIQSPTAKIKATPKFCDPADSFETTAEVYDDGSEDTAAPLKISWLLFSQQELPPAFAGSWSVWQRDNFTVCPSIIPATVWAAVVRTWSHEKVESLSYSGSACDFHKTIFIPGYKSWNLPLFLDTISCSAVLEAESSCWCIQPSFLPAAQGWHQSDTSKFPRRIERLLKSQKRSGHRKARGVRPASSEGQANMENWKTNSTAWPL